MVASFVGRGKRVYAQKRYFFHFPICLIFDLNFFELFEFTFFDLNYLIYLIFGFWFELFDAFDFRFLI